ncbi:hypothetical protein C427_5029 [Paraglaciecola psychrophila 170]|uniref:Uncharacterized protein n=1 Tax=Paraglaciecola psychrophila 170 TaxID=1129794 RepID=K6Z2S4_9ALTE|nr:hypothetical protein C427_5029 [Paraglaciecola psychrophila 170]GAC39329.1 hypothetical protein GPSY_3718 [Paraglaciecola psychrophila 170]
MLINAPIFSLEREIENFSITEHESDLWLLSCLELLAGVINKSLVCLRHQPDIKHSKEKFTLLPSGNLLFLTYCFNYI